MKTLSQAINLIFKLRGRPYELHPALIASTHWHGLCWSAAPKWSTPWPHGVPHDLHPPPHSPQLCTPRFRPERQPHGAPSWPARRAQLPTPCIPSPLPRMRIPRTSSSSMHPTQPSFSVVTFSPDLIPSPRTAPWPLPQLTSSVQAEGQDPQKLPVEHHGCLLAPKVRGGLSLGAWEPQQAL